jgi:uncharacterized membrane protein YdfJ with MMPL/SSD domain
VKQQVELHFAQRTATVFPSLMVLPELELLSVLEVASAWLSAVLVLATKTEKAWLPLVVLVLVVLVLVVLALSDPKSLTAPGSVLVLSVLVLSVLVVLTVPESVLTLLLVALMKVELESL